MRRRSPQLLVVVIAIAGLLAGAASSAENVAPVGPATSTGTGGSAATVEFLASAAAAQTLRAGGNAVDAAVTAAGVLGVTEPFSCGLGGGGFMVIYKANGGKHPRVITIDSRERAPLSMKPDSFMEAGKPLPFNDARYSGLSVGVPGTPRLWEDALKKYGTYTLAKALAPGAAVARNGFEVDTTFASQINDNLSYFADVPAAAALYLDPDGTARDVGSTFRNPDLANTYDLLAKQGAGAFYSGLLADAIVATVQHPSLAANAKHVFRPGLMTADDLKAYKAPTRAPTRVIYRGLDVFGMGPPSSGGTTVGEALNILEGFDLAHMPREQALHLYLEASRLAYADRGQYLGDSDFVKVPVKGLLSKGFAATRRALITDRAATSPVQPGDPAPFQGGAFVRLQTSSTDQPVGTTTHITTTDRQGNVVSYTFTIESTGGSGLVVPGYGFLLNNELTDFNFDSLTAANRAEGGKRPRSSMAPTIVLRGGKPFISVGSPGGSTIITTVLQILVDRIDLGLTLPRAIADPRISQRNGSTSSIESGFLASPVSLLLLGRGQKFGTPAEIGAATGVEFLGGLTDPVVAAAEPTRRGGGSAIVAEPTG